MSAETFQKNNTLHPIREHSNMNPLHKAPVPKPKKKSSSSSDSNSSDLDEPLDSEVLKIKKITSDLTQDITQKLKRYRKIHNVFMNQSELLSTQAFTLQEQQKFVTPIKKLKEKTIEINEKLQKVFQNSKFPTEDDQFSLNDVNLQEILYNLKNPAEENKESLDFDNKIFQISLEKSLTSLTTKENNAKLESEGKNQVCSCIVY